MPLWTGIDPPPRRETPLAPLTTWGIGGPAEWFATPRSVDELGMLLRCAREADLPVRILGGGSNLLVSDEGVAGLVVQLSDEAFRFVGEDVEPGCLRLGAGVPLAKAVEHAARTGLSGLEAFAGIPGTVGGAAVMNAGGVEAGFGHCIEAVEAFDPGGALRRLPAKDLHFGYRASNLAGCLLTGLRLRLSPGDAGEVGDRTRAARREKAHRQPLGARSAGCVFRNPPDASAGELIDRAGCRGWREGGAVVSEKHANFFLNEGGASAQAMRTLIERVRARVREAFDVELETEVTLWT